MLDYAYLVTLGAVIAIIAGSALYTRQLRAQQEAGVQAAAPAPEIAATPQPSPFRCRRLHRLRRCKSPSAQTRARFGRSPAGACCAGLTIRRSSSGKR